MANYTTNLKWAETSGLGIRIVDENVGTGNSLETDFDLDFGNVISGSYTLNHGATGSNTLTALTETTHYTLDKESGRIVLTGAGVTAVGTDIIYATYWYTKNFSDSVVTNLLTNATSQVDLMTGRKWDTPSSIVEYQNGQSSSSYPTTDNPYQADYDSPDMIILDNQKVTKVNNVYFLNQPQSISKFWNYDAGTAAYTDKTSNVNSVTTSPFTLFDDAPTVNDYIYIGCSQIFLGLSVVLSTVGTGSPAIDWEYWNGTAWADITETETDTGASTFEASGKFTWSYPYGWSTTSVNSTSAYWIRGKLTTGYTIDPICATMSIKDSVSLVIEPHNISYQSNGVLYFQNNRVPNGRENVRIDYSYGETTTPAYIEELTGLVASLQAFVLVSGGSYDDATGYTLGSKSVQIGEAWVNVKQVIQEIRNRINDILKQIGSRTDIRAI